LKEEKNDNYKYIPTLRQSPLFENLDNLTLESMIDEFTLVDIKRSDILDSDLGMKYFHIILSGRLKITHIDHNTGKSITIFLLKEGDGFDIFPLLDGEEHTVFPVAIDNITALRAPLNKVREWIKQHQEFNSSFLPYIGKRLRELETSHTHNIFFDTKTRLAKLILKHTDQKYDHNQKHYPVKLIHDLSHESLAELIATSRSVLSTQMKKLREEGIIASKRGLLTVKNLHKLKKHTKE